MLTIDRRPPPRRAPTPHLTPNMPRPWSVSASTDQPTSSWHVFSHCDISKQHNNHIVAHHFSADVQRFAKTSTHDRALSWGPYSNHILCPHTMNLFDHHKCWSCRMMGHDQQIWPSYRKILSSHAWSYMVIVYDNQIIICDEHVWPSYGMAYTHHIGRSYMNGINMFDTLAGCYGNVYTWFPGSAALTLSCWCPDELTFSRGAPHPRQSSCGRGPQTWRDVRLAAIDYSIGRPHTSTPWEHILTKVGGTSLCASALIPPSFTEG